MRSQPPASAASATPASVSWNLAGPPAQLKLATCNRPAPRVDDAIAVAGTPRAKLAALFDAVAELAASPECLGCTFQGTAAEFPDADHPGHRTARRHKECVVSRLDELGAQAGARDPDELARGLLLLMDGAFAAARMFGSRKSPAASVARAARALIDAQLR